MAFKKTEDVRDLDLPTLIDVVFLLLIFFLVAFAFSVASKSSDSNVMTEIDLPRIATDLPPLRDDILDNLMIQIMRDSLDHESVRVAYVLWPSFNKNAPVSMVQAFQTARQESTFAAFPKNYLSLPHREFVQTAPCTLLARSIQRYARKYLTENNYARPIIEVRAEEDIEFRILDFIMNQCSAYDDTLPQFIVRTIPQNRTEDHGI